MEKEKKEHQAEKKGKNLKSYLPRVGTRNYVNPAQSLCPLKLLFYDMPWFKES